MRHSIPFLTALLLAPLTATRAAAAPPVVCWTFDEARDTGAVQQARERMDSLQGAIEFVPGVRGSGLKFDGFTSRLVRAAKDLPQFGPALTVEAWVAPQEHSWAWTGIVDHDQDARAGFFLGINHLGQAGFYASVDGKWLGCDSKEPLALLQWAHVAGTFDPASGVTLYVNGQRVGANAAKGNFKPAERLDLLIGMAHRKQFPALTEREPSKKFLSNMVFDGLMDEVRIFNRALTAEEIKATFTANSPTNSRPLEFRVLPSGPPGPRPFGAFYTRLNYCPEWDRIWRVGDFADVLVCFDELPVRMVFWRGTGYCPAWVTENGKWVSDQGPESWNQYGCCEQMSDKRCHYAHVRILENTDARVVVHWRTASPDITYNFNHVDPDTGWGEWTDEYYYIYPDAVAVRYQEIRSTWAAQMEWQQTELINQPGTRPQDNVELEAVTVVNMDGETETWSWEKPYGKRAPGSQPIKDGNIQVMNLKSKQRHFVIGETGAHWKPFGFGAREGFSTMPCWNHWPVAQLPNDGRVTPIADRPSSTCLGTLFPVKHKTDRPDLMLGRNLYGMTGKPANELAVLARSWNFPAELKLAGSAFEPLAGRKKKVDWNNMHAVGSDLPGANWDYPEASYERRHEIEKEHETYIRGFLWTLANNLRVPEAIRKKTAAYGLPKDEFTDNGGWPWMIYIREARRMVGDYVMTQHDCEGKKSAPDPVALGSFGMDSHVVQHFVTESGHANSDGVIWRVPPKPYGISYRSIIPRKGECENLFSPICVSASHVAHGSIRMEPVFMALSQSAAAAAGVALDKGVSVQEVSYPVLRERLVAGNQRF